MGFSDLFFLFELVTFGFCLDLRLGFECVGFDLGLYLLWLRPSLLMYFEFVFEFRVLSGVCVFLYLFVVSVVRSRCLCLCLFLFFECPEGLKCQVLVFL